MAQAFLIGKDFIGSSDVVLILGDNLFHGDTLETHFIRSNERSKGSTVFAYPVKNPQRYGVAAFDDKGNIVSIDEKPKEPKVDMPSQVFTFLTILSLKSIKVLPSQRGIRNN